MNSGQLPRLLRMTYSSGRVAFWRVTLAFAWMAFSAAQIQSAVAAVHVVQVTPEGFSVYWQAGEAALPGVSVFSDPEGMAEITNELRMEVLPVYAGNFYVPSDYDSRAQRRALQQQMATNGTMLVRVTGCRPDTPYYFRVHESSLSDEGGIRTLPESGDLLHVRTARSTGFTVESRQLVVEFSRSDLAGRAVLLETSSSPYGLVAVIGDGAGIHQAYFNLNDFLDVSGTTTGGLSGEQTFTLTLYGDPHSQPGDETVLSFNGTFTVAEAEIFVFGLDDTVSQVASFEFEPIPIQTAGVPFTVTIRAIDSLGRVVPHYDGTVTVNSTGVMSTGAGESRPFNNGVLASYLVAVEQPGVHRLNVEDGILGKSGASSFFTVATSYSFWELENYPDSSERGAGSTGPWADPGAAGIPNLVRYGLHLDSRHPERDNLPVAGIDSLDGEDYLTLTYRRAKGATDLIYLVEVSGELTRWDSGPDFTEQVLVVDAGSHELVKERDRLPMPSIGSRFMRLRIAHLQTLASWQGEQLASGAIIKRGDLRPGALSPLDGIPNLLRYALGLESDQNQRHLLPLYGTMEIGEEKHLFLSFTRPKDRVDVDYVVEVSSNLEAWFSGAAYTETVSFLDVGETETVTVRDRTAQTESERRFIRLRVIRR